MCLHKREYPGRKAGNRVWVARDFATGSLIGKQLITGQESRYKRYSIQLPLPFFSCFFSPYLAPRHFNFSPFFCLASSPSISPQISPHARSSLRFSFVSASTFFQPYMILSFHTWSSFIHLSSSCISFASSSFSSTLYTSRSVFLPFHRLAFSPPIYFFPFYVKAVPFPSVSPFPPTRRFFHPPDVTGALAFRTRSAREGMVVCVITCTHPGCRRRLRRCVKLGNRFGTRNHGERRAGRLRGTVPRCTCTSQSSRY